MLFYSSLFVLWFFGAFFTGMAITILGERNPSTFGDSYTGDATLDFWICLLWPLFWVAFAGMYLARVVFEHFDDA
ncbi:hypothetical protein AAFO90_10795 [Phaeobacter sp. CAU 1743]|uniref:hypothetical protein n=1 Tax=Phaeobacter sp. CAU 1743 TaxID=3140367 RepID=UPI0023B6A411